MTEIVRKIPNVIGQKESNREKETKEQWLPVPYLLTKSFLLRECVQYYNIDKDKCSHTHHVQHMLPAKTNGLTFINLK